MGELHYLHRVTEVHPPVDYDTRPNLYDSIDPRVRQIHFGNERGMARIVGVMCVAVAVFCTIYFAWQFAGRPGL